MRFQARARLFCFFLVLLAAGWASDCDAAAKNQRPLPVSIERSVDLVIDELTRHGFEVTQGYFRLFHPLNLIQREYISKGTARGPDSTLLLPPKLIRLPMP